MGSFDVPGTVVLRDVSRAKIGETWAEAMHRLAQRGRIEGCVVFAVSDDETTARVTSARVVGRSYRVWIDREHRSALCECASYEVTQMCKHAALAVAELAELPPLDTTPLTAAYEGRCSVTGQTIHPGDYITRSSRGGWMLVTSRDQRQTA